MAKTTEGIDRSAAASSRAGSEAIAASARAVSTRSAAAAHAEEAIATGENRRKRLPRVRSRNAAAVSRAGTQ